MTDPRAYVQLATRVLRKVKGYCQNQACDEPQALALAEQLKLHNLDSWPLLEHAVTRIGGSAAAADPRFHITPARIIAEARAIRNDATARAPLTEIEGGLASEEHRQKCLAEIHAIVDRQGRAWTAPRVLR